MVGAQTVTALFSGPMTTTFYHLDALGSVRIITDETGAVVTRHDYLAFGEDTAPLTGDPRRFAAKELDPETALQNFGARYYRNETGRFTTVDPVFSDLARVRPQGWNRYAYALNGPLRFGDPTGLEAEERITPSIEDGTLDFGGWLDDYAWNAEYQSAKDETQNQEVANLAWLQDVAMANPKWKDEGTATHCNEAVRFVAFWMGASMGEFRNPRDAKYPPLANDIMDSLAKSSNYKPVTAAEAQQLASQGKLVIAGWRDPKGGHGHVTTVRPEAVPGAPSPRGQGPLVAHVGSGPSGVRRASGTGKEATAFRNLPVAYYTPK